MNALKRVKHIHFVGVKGVGVAPLAIIAKEAGLIVSGCDIEEEFITDEPLNKAGIRPLVGFSKEHVTGSDLVITTGAHGGFDNPEVEFARKQGIDIWTQGQAVGEFMKGKILGRKAFTGISVAGSHGKTTTSAMLATVLKHARCDPSFLIGTGNVPSLGAPGHFGKGKYFVAEADEYATEPTHDLTPKFLWQHPKIAIFTNIELDHPDLYDTVEDVRLAFLKFAQKIPSDGVLILGGDDRENQKIKKEFKGRVITYGTGPTNDFMLKRVTVSGNQTFFWAQAMGATLGEFTLKVPGEHNGLNALGAIAVSLDLGLSIATIREGLLFFTGTKRRFEYKGKLKSGAMIFDDYAHHPTEIKSTLLAFKQVFPKKNIICIFQPHTYSRTKKLFEEFISSFYNVHKVIICNIYSSMREEPDPSVSSKKLVDEINRIYGRAIFLPTLPDVIEYVDKQRFGEDTVIVTMGAGDIYKIADALLKSNDFKIAKS